MRVTLLEGPGRLRLVGAVLLCGAVTACASGGTGTGSTSRSSRSPITRDEIADRGSLDLLTVVQQLRPSWLQNRGQATPVGGVRQVRVVIDGRLQPGSVEVLRSLRGAEVQELRYLRGRDAQTRYGMDTEGGVIVVTTDRGGGTAPP